MDKKTLIEKAKAMIAAPSCNPNLKAAGQAWIDSTGKADEKEKAEKMIEEIKNGVTTIDELVAFARSDVAAKMFGDGIKGFIAHADELKAKGAKYCDCGACAPALEIFENKETILG